MRLTFIFKISCHLEMSYFEVYNEKIHDLLVAKDEQNLKKMPVSPTTQLNALYATNVMLFLCLHN